MNSLGQRVVTAVILIALLLAVLFLAPPALGVLVAGLLFLLAGWEWSRFLGWTRTRARAAYAIFIGLVLAAALWLVPARIALMPVLLLSLAWWLVAFVWVCRFPTPVPPWLAAVAGPLVLVPVWLGVATLVLTRPAGPILLLLVLGIVWAADIGAFFVGRRIGRLRLAPRVSPGKTWEGVAGGLVCATAAAAAGGAALGFPVGWLAFAGFSVGAISVLGDLTESMFKRNVGVKDSGRIFPGHGGVLDRIDSLTAAIPLYVLELRWLGLA